MTVEPSDEVPEGSFDPEWYGAILHADVDLLRERIDGMVAWARSRLDHLDRELAGCDLANPNHVVLVHLTERTSLIAVLTQLAGDEE